MDLGGGNHVVCLNRDGAVALAQAVDSVRDRLEAGLPGTLDAESDLVPARNGQRNAVENTAR